MEVVITGASGRLPQSSDLEEFRLNLYSGVDMVTEDDPIQAGAFGLPGKSGSLKNSSKFDGSFFGVHAKQIRAMDPQMGILLELTHEAILDSGRNPKEFAGTRTGVVVGQTVSDSQSISPEDTQSLTGYELIGSSRAMMSNRISYTFDLKGPSYTVDTGCSSSMYALVQAVEMIRIGVCDRAIVAGTNLLLKPEVSVLFLKLGMLSPKGVCASFDEQGSGYVRSEGIVVICLEKRCEARRIYAEVLGCGYSCDGFKPEGITFPSRVDQCELISQVLKKAGVQPSQVTYIEAHASGTKAGDVEEAASLAKAYRGGAGDSQTLLVGSVKSNMGHPEGTSGLASLVKLIFAMESSIIPANLHYSTPNHAIPSITEGTLQVVAKNTVWEEGFAGINSFGFGGTNSHLVLSRNTKKKRRSEETKPRLVAVTGRTHEAVLYFLNKLENMPLDVELVQLVHEIHKVEMPGHSFRGFTVLGNTSFREISESRNVGRRELWYVFGGMGSQYGGMGRALMDIEPFSRTITRCSEALAFFKLDLTSLIMSSTQEDLGIVNSFVLITAIEVGLVEVLKAIGLAPDGMIGHSLGELACAFADGCLSVEKTIIAAYHRASSFLHPDVPQGAMLAVGLGWDEVKARLPSGIELTCDNGPKSVTVSGLPDSIAAWYGVLKEEGIACSIVDSCGFAFHSTYSASSGARFKESLLQVLTEPKERSHRWLSSSVIDEANESGGLVTADYFVNNLVSPVKFRRCVSRIPPGALVVELSPHSLLTSTVKTSLHPSSVAFGLLHKKEASLECFLRNLGRLFNLGLSMDLSALYPKLDYPVSRGTPMISPMVRWDHSGPCPAMHFLKSNHQRGQCTTEINIAKEEWEYLKGHQIDGRVLFPAPGYMVLVWKAFASLKGKVMEEIRVHMENITFLRATLLTREGGVKLGITILQGSGEFEVKDGDNVVVTGRIKERTEKLDRQEPEKRSEQEDLPECNLLTKEDIYKELRLRGYEYSEYFQNIISASPSCREGKLNACKNWVTSIEVMLQFSTFAQMSDLLHITTKIGSITIDPKRHLELLESSSSSGVDVVYDKQKCEVRAGGVSITGVEATQLQRRTPHAPPRLEEYLFVPYFHSEVMSKEDVLTILGQIVAENVGKPKLDFLELTEGRAEDETSLALSISEILHCQPRYQVEVVQVSLDPKTNAVIERDEILSKAHMVVAREVSDVLIKELAERLGSECFLLTCRELQVSPPLEEGYTLVYVSKYSTLGVNYFLYKKTLGLVENMEIRVTHKDFNWVDDVKKLMEKRDKLSDKVLLKSEGEPTCGIIGFFNSLRKEPGGTNFRCLFNLDESAREGGYNEELKRGLAMNVFKNGVWGAMRHICIKQPHLTPVHSAFVNAPASGDVSTLRWVQAPSSRALDGELCWVYYASLGPRDLLLASGKISSSQDSHLGVEFSGRTACGRRVMGLVRGQAMATSVLTDPLFLWNVPEHWTLEEAATVPASYSMAYYALVVKGRIKSGQRVLIHSGSDDIGQASISLALSLHCTVFSTADTQAQRDFIKKKFPQVKSEHIGSCEDASFEAVVQEGTGGEGVDLILGGLPGHLLEASLRCLASGGAFLNLPLFGLASNSFSGVVLRKNTSVHNIDLEELLETGHSSGEKAEVARLLNEGVSAGIVKPLPLSSYSSDRLQEAFRFAMSGKHIGKVLLNVRREEEEGGTVSPQDLTISAVPRVYFDPDKSYIVIGGLGGTGLELLKWMASRGMRRLVVMSRRSSPSSGYEAIVLKKLEAKGVTTLFHTSDPANPAQDADKVIDFAQSLAPVGGIFNLAANIEKMQAGLGAKALLTSALDEVSRSKCPTLDWFVTFSSLSCGRGNAGQTSYSLANSTMERICELRRQAGLPAVAIQWGAIGDVGMVIDGMGADNATVVAGTLPQRIHSCLAVLDILLSAGPVVGSMVVAPVQPPPTSKPASDKLSDAVAKILGLKDSKGVERSTLRELGMDSLMSAEIQEAVARATGQNLDAPCLWALSLSDLDLMQPQAPPPISPSPSHQVELQEGGGGLVPTEVMVRMTTRARAEVAEGSVFFIHPIEGNISALLGVASMLDCGAWGLQAARSAPADSIQSLAAFYIQHVLTVDKEGPYVLAGYSYGAIIGFEMAIQLEALGKQVTLICIDGSPRFVVNHIETITKTYAALASIDIIRAAYLVIFFTDRSNLVEIIKTLKASGNMVESLRTLLGGNHSPQEVEDTLRMVSRRSEIASLYEPSTSISSSSRVILLRAHETFLQLPDDYCLGKHCKGEVEVHTLIGNHQTILTGESSVKIADVINEAVKKSVQSIKTA